MQVDIVLEGYRTCKPYSLRDHKVSASHTGKIVYRFRKCVSIQGPAVSYASEVSYADFKRRYGRT